MKNLLFSTAFLCLAGLLTGCSSSIKTVVDRNTLKQPYKSSLMVILYDPGVTRHFCEKVKDRMELNMQQDAKKTEFIMVKKTEQKELSLNDKESANEMIDTAIQNNDFGVVIIFKPTHYTFSNGSISQVTYQITALDVTTKKEVWKAETVSGGAFGLNGIADKTADLIYGRLVGRDQGLYKFLIVPNQYLVNSRSYFFCMPHGTKQADRTANLNSSHWNSICYRGEGRRNWIICRLSL